MFLCFFFLFQFYFIHMTLSYLCYLLFKIDNYIWYGGAAFGSVRRAYQKGVQGMELL